jgi:hypothetical protein
VSAGVCVCMCLCAQVRTRLFGSASCIFMANVPCICMRKCVCDVCVRMCSFVHTLVQIMHMLKNTHVHESMNICKIIFLIFTKYDFGTYVHARTDTP